MQPSPIAAAERFTCEGMHDVFRKMLGLELKDEEPVALAPEAGGHIICSVGFAGKTTGIVHLCAGVGLAGLLTGNMLGIDQGDVDDDMINDAFGELTNMVVGSVKSRLSDGGWPCVLTIPSTVRGDGMRIQAATGAEKRIFGFRTCEHRLIVQTAVKETLS